MRFSTVLAISVAASASTALAYPAAYETVSRRDVTDVEDLLLRDYDELTDLVARGTNKKTSKSAEAATKGQAAAKKLPNEIKADIGRQGLDGSKAAADRAKTLGTSTKDIQSAYKNKAHQELKNGQIPNASWGLQATLDHNRHLRRALDAEYEELVDLVARGTNKKTSKSAQAATSGQAAAKKLPKEIKAEIGRQGLDGSKAAADRAKTLGTSTKNIQGAYKNKAHQELKSGQIPDASWGLQATLDNNRRL